jgi:hypothetical protein
MSRLWGKERWEKGNDKPLITDLLLGHFWFWLGKCTTDRRKIIATASQ